MAIIKYDTYLEIWPNGTALAQITDLPGCFALAPSEQAAINHLRVAVPDYFRWLSMLDDETPTMSGEVDLQVRERVPVVNNVLHEVRAFFATDAVPVSDDDLDWGVALMSHAHQDIIKQVQTLDDGTLDWQMSADSSSIRQLIEHLTQTEAWGITRLDEHPFVPLVIELPGTTLERFSQIHERAMLWVREASPEMQDIKIGRAHV